LETNLTEKKYDHLPLGISGLGGWLILVQVGIYITMLMLLLQLFQYSIPAISPETWNVFTSNKSEFYHPLWGPVLIFETLYNILLLIFCVYILFNLYKRKFILPRLMILFYSTSLIVGIIDSILLYQIPFARETEDGNSLRDTARSIITCAIWIPYFMKSKRVKNTFVR
jgi:hypothetical protein